jgi:hypothetical protein
LPDRGDRAAQQLSKPSGDDINYAEELTRLLESLDSYWALDQYLARLARVLVVLGRVDLMDTDIANTSTGMVFFDNDKLSARAVLAQARQENADALVLYEKAAAAWAPYGYPLEQAHALIGAARCATSHDEPARERLEQARAFLTDIGARPLLAETDRLLETLWAN